MKKILLLVAMTMTFVFANAQNEGGQQFRQFGGHGFNPEQMATHQADRLKKVCDLNDEQYAKVLDLYKTQSEEMMKQFQNRQPGQPFNREEMQKLREEMDAKIKEILTEEQFVKYQEMQKRMPRPGFGGHHGHGRPSTPPTE